jgi:hypothetical protein
VNLLPFLLDHKSKLRSGIFVSCVKSFLFSVVFISFRSIRFNSSLAVSAAWVETEIMSDVTSCCDSTKKQLHLKRNQLQGNVSELCERRSAENYSIDV